MNAFNRIVAPIVGLLVWPFVGSTSADEAIELAEDQQLQIRQIMPTDCRVVRGFTHSPIDGREDTRYNNNVVAPPQTRPDRRPDKNP